jgi:hypothetical protein
MWIELTDALGNVLARRPEDAVPCTIGSARDNTIVVDGDEILPYHARIDANQDGTLSVTALGAHPGLHRPGAPERQPTLLLTATAPVAIGQAMLRLVSTEMVMAPAAAVAAPEEEGPPTGWRAWAARKDVQWGSALFLVLAGMAVSWYTVPVKNRELTAFFVGLFVLFAVALWAAFFALIGRLRHGKAKFGQHLVVATVMTVVSLLISELASWQEFLIPAAEVMAGLMLILTSVTVGVTLFAQLRVFSTRNREKHLRIAAGATAVMLILAVAAARYTDDWSSTLDFSAVLKPWPVSWTPARGVETYGESLSKLEKELEKDGADPAAVISPAE